MENALDRVDYMVGESGLAILAYATESLSADCPVAAIMVYTLIVHTEPSSPPSPTTEGSYTPRPATPGAGFFAQIQKQQASHWN